MACCACDRSGPIVARQLNRERVVLGLVSEVKSNPAQTRSQEMSSLHSGRKAGPGTYNLHFFLEAPSNRD